MQKSVRPVPRPDESIRQAAEQHFAETADNSVVMDQMKGAGTGDASSFLQPGMPPTFEGFEDDRYQEHDERIAALVEAFNLDKGGFIGATAEQAASIPDLDPALVKSWLIQEAGGGDKRSRRAWATDPAQVNVPGDWGAPKGDEWMGLSKPSRRNEGDIDTNLKAAITWLTRKGFSRSGKAPQDLIGDSREFGGWRTALENYNGRGDRFKGKKYKQVYADKILERASSPNEHLAINW